MPGKLCQQLFMGILGGGGILIHPQDAGLRKSFANSSSAFWVPKPRYCSLPPQAGHLAGGGSSWLPQ